MSVTRLRSSLIAQNSNLRVNAHVDMLQRSLERLSSGQRINRAADDAAGSAIASSMTAQIRGTAQAQRNVQDGINMARIADGGLQVIGDLLQRMRELVVQAANGVYRPEQRAAIQQEIVALNAAIDEAVDAAQFNGIHPLNQLSHSVPPPGGGSGTPPTPVFASEDIVFLLDNTGSTTSLINSFVSQISSLVTAVQAFAPGTRFGVSLVNGVDDNYDGVNKVLDFTSDPTQFTAAALTQALTLGYTQPLARGGQTDFYAGILQSLPATYSAQNPGDGIMSAGYNGSGSYANSRDYYNFNAGSPKRFIMFTDTDREGDFVGPSLATPRSPFAGTPFDETQAQIASVLMAENARLDIVGNAEADSLFPNYGYGAIRQATGGQFYDYSAPLSTTLSSLAAEIQAQGTPLPPGGTPPLAGSSGAMVTLQVGANQGQTLDIYLTDARAASIGTSAVDVTGPGDPAANLTLIDDALNYVLGERTRWGAYDGRLAHTSGNLGIGYQNQSQARSRIEDIDVAVEVAGFVRARILVDAGIAVSLHAIRAPMLLKSLLTQNS